MHIRLLRGWDKVFFPWLATKCIIDAAPIVKPRRRYLATTAILTSNVLPRNYRTKVSWYNEFYRGIARTCRINAIVHDWLMQQYSEAFIGSLRCVHGRARRTNSHISYYWRIVYPNFGKKNLSVHVALHSLRWTHCSTWSKASVINYFHVWYLIDEYTLWKKIIYNSQKLIKD